MSKGGGGSGGKKGGGGGGTAPKINPNPGETTQQQTLTDLASYESSMLPTFESMGNWAANLATGGAATPITALYAGQEPYQTNQLATSPQGWAPGINTLSSLGGATGESSGVAGLPGSNISAYGTPSKNDPSGSFLGASPVSGQFADLKPVYDSGGQYIGYQNPEGQFFSSQSISAQGLGVPGFALPPSVLQGGGGGGQAAPPSGGATQGTTGLTGPGSALNTEWQNILNAEGVIPQISGIEQQTAQSGQQIAGLQGSVNQEVAALQPTQTGQLLPGQQALIDAQVKSGQSQLNQQLASMGLGKSTMGTELGAEIGLQGAATGGQLEQGNIQLLQGAQNLSATVQKLALGQQQLSLGEQDMMFNQFSQIAQQAGGVQSQLYSEALQGYGMLGNVLNSITSAYGVNVQAYGDELNAEAARASDQTSLQVAELQSQQSQASMMGGLFSGIGSILGAGGSSGIGASLGGLITSGVGALAAF